METIGILWKQLKNALSESFTQPWNKKWKHFCYRMAWELRPAFKSPGKFPLAVDVELSSYCNFRCKMCQQDTGWWNDKKITKKQSQMKWHTFKKVVDECAELGVYSMKVNWRGEPMANPDLPKHVRYMKEKGIHEVMMNTNASYLDYDSSFQIIDSGIDRVIFSCDGLSKETYNKIRVGGDFDRFMESLITFKRMCDSYKKLGVKVPIIRVNMSFQKANAHEIPRAEEFFKDLADELRINTVYNPQMSNEWLGDEHRTKKRKGCPQIYQRLIVSNDGNIIPCCVDFMEQLNLGNVEKVSLREAYTKRVQRIRRAHERHEGRQMSACDKCDNFALSTVKDGEVVWN